MTPEWAERICTEFMAVLAAEMPKRKVARADGLAAGTDGLAVRVEFANASNVGLQLTWHPASAAKVAARPLALSVMDRATTESMRNDFYRRVLSDAPIPL